MPVYEHITVTRTYARPVGGRWTLIGEGEQGEWAVAGFPEKGYEFTTRTVTRRVPADVLAGSQS